MESRGPGVEVPLVPPLRGKGRLLLTEGPDALQSRVFSFRRAGAILLSAGFVTSVFGGTFSLWGGAGPLVSLASGQVVLIGAILAALGVVVLAYSGRLRPIMFFENGLEVSSLFGGRPIFYSWGEMTGVVETKNAIDGPIYLLRTRVRGPFLAIRKDLRGFADLLPSIQTKFGRPEFLVDLETTPDETEARRRAEHWVYAVAAGLGVLVSATLSLAANPGDPIEIFLSGLGLLMPAAVTFMVTATAFLMRGNPKLFPRKIDVRIPAIIIVAMLVYFFASEAVFSNAFGPSPFERHIGPKPTSSALGPGVYESQTVHADRNLLVDSGQTIELRNSTLVFDLAANGGAGIWVANGGRLVLENSSVVTADSRYRYTFEVMGFSRIRNSTISGLWGESDDYDGGLELYSDDVVIEGSHIFGARQTGILVVDSSPLIANSTIEGSGDDGIELQHSTARIVGNVITHCEWGIYMYKNSRPLIEGNRISDNSFGLLILNSSPEVLNNTFERNEHTAVRYGENSAPVLAGNTYIQNGQDVIREGETPLPYVWAILTVGIAGTCLVALFVLNRRSKLQNLPPR